MHLCILSMCYVQGTMLDTTELSTSTRDSHFIMGETCLKICNKFQRRLGGKCFENALKGARAGLERRPWRKLMRTGTGPWGKNLPVTGGRERRCRERRCRESSPAKVGSTIDKVKEDGHSDQVWGTPKNLTGLKRRWWEKISLKVAGY